MRKTPLLPLILCAALSGCDPLIEPQPVPVSLTTARLTGPMLPVVIMAGRDTIRINGSIGVNEPCYDFSASAATRSEEHTSELQSRLHLVCRLLLEKKKTIP